MCKILTYLFRSVQVLEATGPAMLFVDLKAHSDAAVEEYVRAFVEIWSED